MFCPIENSLANPNVYISTSHSISMLTIPFNFLTLAVIFFKNSRNLRALKLALLYNQFWSLFGDLLIGTLIIPYIFVPWPAGFPCGLLTEVFGINPFVQGYVLVVVICGKILHMMNILI
ncbi:unnamed protein product [Caenorhabditis angaria]|uniref:Uncharacterized protein n=1 Tax=Caenorhabditis angaria TaxID=860376 RepID=A0A9P1N702_9PELO|nr:unnamed protein product [Caenorhabditis angaria]